MTEKWHLRIVVILTDIGPRESEVIASLSSQLVIDLCNFFEISEKQSRVEGLFHILRMIGPRAVHILNSEIGWEMVSRINEKKTDYLWPISCSVFAMQYLDLERKHPVGYAWDHLSPNLTKVREILTDNERFRNDLHTFEFSEHIPPISVIHNAVEVPEYVNSARSRIDQGSRMKILWAGRVGQDKRVDLLSQIAAEVADFADINVFGKVEQGTDAAALARLSNVSLMGEYRDPSDWEKLGRCDAFLFTSRWEGMPNVILEAVARNYPIIAANVGGVSEILGDGCGWLVSPQEPAKAYAEVLRTVYDNLDAAQERCVRAKSVLKARHSKMAFKEDFRKTIFVQNLLDRS